MRVAFIRDFTWAERPGGATRMLALLEAAAPSDIEIVGVGPSNWHDLDSCDVAFSYLAKTFPDEAYEAIIRHPCHIRWEIDWWHPFEPNSRWRNSLNEQARLVFYVSPLHRDRFMALYGVTPKRSVVLPCPMDVEGLLKLRRPDGGRSGTIWFGEWHPYKGVDLVARWAFENKTVVDFYSPTMPKGTVAPNRYCRLMGFISEDGWYETVAGYERFVHFPRHPDCFPYSVLEAFALGLEVVVRGRLGVESFGLPWEELLSWCNRSAKQFWDIMLNTV